MTPQEKATKLIDQYRLILIQSETDAGEEILCTTIAKQCALVAVDEVTANIEPSISEDVASARFKYWEQVKIEIESI
jgi:hypothetical protein